VTSGFQLAQVNIGRTRGEMTDPVMAEFVARLPEINALADQSPGFVWRLQTEAVERLAHLEATGPTPFAFTFGEPFGPDGRPVPREGATRDDACPAT
jgi:hypothetical protein